MGLAVDSKIKIMDAMIPLLQIDYEVRVVDHKSSVE